MNIVDARMYRRKCSSLGSYGRRQKWDDTYTNDIVMTSCRQGQESTVRIERLPVSQIEHRRVHHAADGPFKGIIINKPTKCLPDVGRPTVRMEFVACMTDKSKSGDYETRETRELRFWFKPKVDKEIQVNNAKMFFKQLLQPEGFPRDYVNFIKKAVLLARQYTLIKRLDMVLRPSADPALDEPDSVDEEEVVLQMQATPASGAYARSDIRDQWEEKLEEVLEDSREQMIENFITVLTPAMYDYQYLPEVRVNDKTFLAFRLRAKSNAHIALSSVYGDTDRKTYEIVIGGWDNLKSAIRYGGQGRIVQEAMTLSILHPVEFRPFWLSWGGGLLQVGKGMKKGVDRFLYWRIPPSKLHSVNCIAVSTGFGSEGEWEFVEHGIFEEDEVEEEIDPSWGLGGGPPKENKLTRSARRFQIRQALLWAAKKQIMLQKLEDAYPSSLTTLEILRLSQVKMNDMMSAVSFLKDLQKKGIIQEVSRGVWMRASKGAQDKHHEVKIVKDLPQLPASEAPSIAMITALYCEKLAVDAMMERKVSYVKYKTEKGKRYILNDGESYVYTVGRMGNHSVVSVKLSRVGAGRSAAIAAGNTVTRLLGTFNKVQHVFLVGVAGAVPNYTDIRKHVRLGDIIVSLPGKPNSPLYIHCDKVEQKGDSGTYSYMTRYWKARNDMLEVCISQLRGMHELRSFMARPWERNIDAGLELLEGEERDFSRPPSKSDRLYALIDNEPVHVEHPRPPRGQEYLYRDNQPQIRYGAIGSGKYVARNRQLRMDFAGSAGIICYTAEFDAVLDSIVGNRNDSFIIIRGTADYLDGLRNREWQPYASLCAAAFAKAVVLALPAYRRVSGYTYY